MYAFLILINLVKPKSTVTQNEEKLKFEAKQRERAEEEKQRLRMEDMKRREEVKQLLEEDKAKRLEKVFFVGSRVFC